MYRVDLARDYFTFSAAHFVVPDDVQQRELLHGHNYAVTASVESSDLKPDVVLDFSALKRDITRVCSNLNHKVLIPKLNPKVSLGIGEAVLGLGVGDSGFVFPRSDAVMLPVRNITCETLAWWIAENLAARSECGFRQGMRLTIRIEECPGQSGSYTLQFSDIPRGTLREINTTKDNSYDVDSMQRAFQLAKEASSAGGSPFGAVVLRDGLRVAEASNQTVGDSPINHAELAALNKLPPAKAGGPAGDLMLYSTCEPCIMCLMAAYYASVRVIVYATPIADAVHRASGDPNVDARAVAVALGLGIKLIGPVDSDAGRELFDSHLERWGHL
jgi:6-pyruvoyltetrahydropterin/6-carboxytetrahydropterin synthase